MQRRSIISDIYRQLMRLDRLTPENETAIYYRACFRCEKEGAGPGRAACYVGCPIAKDYRARLKEVWG